MPPNRPNCDPRTPEGRTQTSKEPLVASSSRSSGKRPRPIKAEPESADEKAHPTKLRPKAHVANTYTAQAGLDTPSHTLPAAPVRPLTSFPHPATPLKGDQCSDHRAHCPQNLQDLSYDSSLAHDSISSAARSPTMSCTMMDFGAEAEPEPSINHPLNEPEMIEPSEQQDKFPDAGDCLHYIHPVREQNPLRRAECFRLTPNVVARGLDISYWTAIADIIYDRWWLAGHVLSQHRKFFEHVTSQPAHPRHQSYIQERASIVSQNSTTLTVMDKRKPKKPPMCQVTCDIYSIHIVVFLRVRGGLGESTTRCSEPSPDTLQVVWEWGPRSARYAFLVYDEGTRQWWHAVPESTPLTYKLPGWKRTSIYDPPPALVPKPVIPSTTSEEALQEWNLHRGDRREPQKPPSYPSSVVSDIMSD